MPRKLAKRDRARRRGRPDPSFSARTQILLGAADAFGAKGYADTSVQDVLTASGVSRRTFYRFFRSKEELFEQLYEAASMLFLQSMRSAVDLAKTPEEKLANCLDLYLRAPQTVGPVFSVLQAESSRPGTKLFARREAVLESLAELFAESFRKHKGHDIDPLIIRGIIAAQERIALHIFHEHPGDDAAIQRARAAMLHIAEGTLAHVEDEAGESDPGAS
jgi:AcrR family transcriptional regulator